MGGSYRKVVNENVELTFSATVCHLCHAIRKLAAVATEQEMKEPLFRAVRGVLPKTFWFEDKGMVCALDYAFMSTSRKKETPLGYMDKTPFNVLWELSPQAADATAFHYGA